MNPITQLIIGLVPEIIDLIQTRHAANNPNRVPLTPAEIEAGFEATFTSSVAKDELIRAAILATQG